MRAIVGGYIEAAGLKSEGVSCHSLRHSCATWAYAQTGDLLAVSQLLGHASVTTTQIYAQVADAVADNPARALAGALELAT